MKKFLSLLAVCALTIGASAQQLNNAPVERVKAAQTLTKVAVPATQYQGQAQKVSRRSLADGVHYVIPEGMLFPGWTEEWRYWAVSYIYGPAFYEMKFQNDCGTNSSVAQWSMETASGTTLTHDQFAAWGNVDEDNNFMMELGCYPSGYYVPSITVGNTSYRYGNLDPSTGKVMQNAAYNSFMVDTIDYKALSNTFPASMYGFGSLSTGYLFGTGSLTITSETAAEQYRGKTFISDGFVQYYSKPAAPLYVEEFFFPVVSSTETPMAEGTSFVINFMKTAKNDEGEDSITNEIIKQFVVTSENFISPSPGEDNSMDIDYTITKKAWKWNLVLQEVEKDAVGNDVVVPFILDSSFAIVVRGMNQEGIDVGFRAHRLDPDDVTHPCGCFGLDYDNEDLLYQHWYGNDMQLTCFLYGGFDYCEVLDNVTLLDEDGEPAGTLENINVLHVSADGTTVTNDNEAAQEQLEGSALLYTSYPWIDELTGADNYEVEGELPEWIIGLAGIDLADDKGDRTGMELVTVECEPLEAGQSGRAAMLMLHGKGYKSELPIFVLQGDATVEDAIQQSVEPLVLAPEYMKGIYSLNGQRVDKNFKGIVVKNGKKMFQK